MPGNPGLIDPVDKVLRRKALEGGDAKSWIDGKEIVGSGMNIGEITPPAAGNPDLLGRLFRMLKDENPPASLARFNGAHQASGSGTDDDYIIA